MTTDRAERHDALARLQDRVGIEQFHPQPALGGQALAGARTTPISCVPSSLQPTAEEASVASSTVLVAGSAWMTLPTRPASFSTV